MATVVWDEAGKKLYETGTDRGVLYPKTAGAYGTGVPWNGLTGVTENPTGAEETKLYANNNKYASLRSAEEFGFTIEAYTYPDEWAECDGSAVIALGARAGQQSRKSFGLTYRTLIGNDEDLNDHGYKIHIIYGATASPSERGYETVNDSPEAITFSWECDTTPVPVPGFKPTSCITIDSTDFVTVADIQKLTNLENILYGTPSSDPRLPLPDEVMTVLGTTVEIVDVDLAALTIGTLALTPAFKPSITSYTANTTNATDPVVAIPEDADATISIKNGSTTVNNGATASWAAGQNTIKVTVTGSDSETTKVYTVVVTKS